MGLLPGPAAMPSTKPVASVPMTHASMMRQLASPINSKKSAPSRMVKVLPSPIDPGIVPQNIDAKS